MFQDPSRKISELAASDASFREALLADPRGALGGRLGLVIPDDWELEVFEGADGAVEVRFADDQIPDDALELVSGGGSGCGGGSDFDDDDADSGY